MLNPTVSRWTLGRRKARTWGFLALTLAAAALFVAGSCGSLPKGELEQQLRKLGKNASLGGLERIAFRADLGEGPEDLELIYHFAPAQEEAQNPALTPGDPVPIVLVHGTPSTLFSWAELIYGRPASDGREGFEGLNRTHDVYAIEIIGHGIASGDVSPYGFERCARFVTAALHALELDRVHLVGSSYGGEFAWRAALNEPERIESLVLLDSSGVRRRDQDWLSEEVLMRENSLAKIGWRLNSRDRIESALAPHFRELPPDRVEEFFLVCENAHNWKAMVDLARDENGEREADLVGMQPPTLLLWGAEDLAYPVEYYGQRFADAIPLAELVSLPNTGHYPHEERPGEVIRVLTAFLEKHRSDQ